MKAKLTGRNEIIDLPIGQPICGYCFEWIQIEAADRHKLFPKSPIERELIANWLDHVIACRLFKPNE